MLLQRSLSKVALGLVSRVIKGMNGLRETLCLLLWHSLSFSQAILHTSQQLWAGSFILHGGCFPQEATARTCPRLGQSPRSSSPSSHTTGLLSQTQHSVIRGTAAPVLRSVHFQPDFPRIAKQRQSCCISLSSAHSPATSDTANRFQAGVTKQQRSWRQSESINFMGTDYQTEERHY